MLNDVPLEGSCPVTARRTGHPLKHRNTMLIEHCQRLVRPVSLDLNPPDQRMHRFVSLARCQSRQLTP
jgi:hypothetical protein